MLDIFGNENVTCQFIERDLLADVFIKTIRGISAEQLVAMLYSKFEAVVDFGKLCGGKKTGEKLSMLFNPHRYSTPTKKAKSIIDAFNDENFLHGLARATLFKDSKVKELLYQVLQLGINGIQYVNEFPPHIARDFYVGFNARRILDPCAGWGGRMIGAASVGSFYHGFEPATKTYRGLLELGNFLKTFKNGFDFNIENTPFEDCTLVGNYDFALTSPPYYDTEIYSDEQTNSCNRYETFTDWCNGFYIPMITKTVNHAESFVLNVGSRGYDLKSILFDNFKVVQDVNDKLSGGGGLGRKRDGKESFYLIKRS